VLEALDALDDTGVSDADLWQLMEGGPRDKQSLARIIGARPAGHYLETLALLAHDQSSRVRAKAARWLSRWMVNGVASNECVVLVTHLAKDLGTDVATVIADGLGDHCEDPLVQSLVEKLRSHISNSVRQLCFGRGLLACGSTHEFQR